MKYSDIELYLSAPRLGRYFATCRQQSLAVKLYKANLTVAQAFHPLLGVFEVALRNNLYRAVERYFGDPHWIINQKAGFMSDATLRPKHFLRRQIDKAEHNLRQRGCVPNTGRVVAELMLGFWTDLFEVEHYRLIGGSPIHAFTHLPAGTQRSRILDDLTRVRRFRNRVNHNEPLILRSGVVDCSHATDVYNTLIDLLIWLDPNLIKFIKTLDRVNRSLSKCQSLYDSRTIT